MPGEIFLKQLEIGPMANYVYLIGDPGARECAVVDPGWDSAAILEAVEAEGYRLRAALLTHNHFDHVNALGALLKAVDIPVYAHRADAGGVKDAASNLKPVSAGDSMRLGALEVSFLHTPGHTAGSQCLKLADNLVTGDTLFINGCGRVDLPSSDPSQMYESLKKLSSLPAKTVIWPGHNYAEDPNSPLSRQLSTNPYLKASATQSLPEFLRLLGA